MSTEESNPPREASISVLKDNGNKVILAIHVPGLKRKSNIFKAIWRLFSKPSDPFRLSSNASFSKYSLTSGSLELSVDVYESKEALRQHSEILQRYYCKINQFPSRINPESAEFELQEAASGNCYFLLTCIKIDNLHTNWKDYQATNGTLDVTQVS